MATITRGYTFGATEQVTNTKLHTLVDSATLSSLAQTDLGSGLGLISVSSSAPSDTDQLWIDTSLGSYVVKFYDGTNWVPTAERQIFTNKSGQTLSNGHVVIFDTSNSNSFTTTATSANTLFAGIVQASVSNNSTTTVRRFGYVPVVTMEISASAGSYLRTSTASGKAEPVGSYGAGIFGLVTQAGTASAAAFLFGSPGGGVGTNNANTWTALQTFSASANIAAGASFFINSSASAMSSNWLVKGYVNFDGNGASGTIRGSHNCSSVTRVAAGNYIINLASAFSGANWVAIANNGCSSTGVKGYAFVNGPYSASAVQVGTTDNNGATLIDQPYVSVIFVGI